MLFWFQSLGILFTIYFKIFMSLNRRDWNYISYHVVRLDIILLSNLQSLFWLFLYEHNTRFLTRNPFVTYTLQTSTGVTGPFRPKTRMCLPVIGIRGFTRVSAPWAGWVVCLWFWPSCCLCQKQIAWTLKLRFFFFLICFWSWDCPGLN